MSDPEDSSQEGTSGRARGALLGLSAYVLWGAMALYVRQLAPAGAWEILAHRIVWAFVLCVVILAVTEGFADLLRVLRRPRGLLAVVGACALITINWVVYLLAVTSGHVADAALGYFLNPLVSVALGLGVLGERIRPLQGLAVAIGAIGALFLTVASGAVPVVPLVLAFSFGLYGLLKNRMGAHLSAAAGLTAETAVLTPAALLVIAVLGARGEATATSYGVGHFALLASTGLMTGIPLLLFAAAVRRVTLVTIGLLQFVAPFLQFLTALWLGESLSAARWAGFAIVWLALAVLVADLVRSGVRRRRAAAVVPPT